MLKVLKTREFMIQTLKKFKPTIYAITERDGRMGKQKLINAV